MPQAAHQLSPHSSDWAGLPRSVLARLSSGSRDQSSATHPFALGSLGSLGSLQRSGFSRDSLQVDWLLKAVSVTPLHQRVFL